MRTLAGISSDLKRPGFKHIIMKPDFSVDEMDDIKASYKSIYGNIVSRWRKDGGKLYWHVEIPANTTAEVHLPDGTVKNIGSGSYDFTATLPVQDEAVISDDFLIHTSIFPTSPFCHNRGDYKRRFGLQLTLAEQGNAIPMCAFGLAANQKQRQVA